MKPLMNNNLPKKENGLTRYFTKQYSSDHFTYNQIFSMLIPLILDQFFIYFISTLTTFMISASDEASVAAVTLVNPITFIVMALFSSISAGGTVIVAQYKGKGDEELVKRSAGQVILLVFFVATVSGILLILFAEPIVTTLFRQAETEVLQKAKEYLIGFSFSLPMFSIFNSVFNVLRGVGDTKTCLNLTILINLIHLFGSYIFINIMGLDILGTTLSFNLARLIGGVIALYIILRPNERLTLRLRDIWTYDPKILTSTIKMGFPYALEQVFLNAGRMLTQVYMVQLGKSAIAADAIASSASNLFYSAGFGVSTLAITVVGQCIGAGDIEQAKKYGKSFIRLGTACMILNVAVLYPFMPLIIKLSKPAEAIVPIIYQALLIGVIAIPFFWSMSYVMPSVLRAGGDAGYTSIASLIIMWVVRVALGYVLAIQCQLGVAGVWISLGAEWAVRSVVFWFRYKSGKWHEKSIV